MRITRATLGMAPADYITNCSECRASLVKARGDRFYHHWPERGTTTARTICGECAGQIALEAHLTRNKIEDLAATARIIHESRSH